MISLLKSKFKHQVHHLAHKLPVQRLFGLALQKTFSLFRIFFQGVSGILIKKHRCRRGLDSSERLGVKRGLRNPDGTGVLAGLTNVCDVVGYKKDQEGHVIPTPGKLIYRGVNINEIVDEAYRNDRFVFEEVIWLLLFGSLPNREQLDDFCEILAEHRALPEGFMDTMNAPSPNVMNKMQRCVLGLYSYDEHAEDLSLENILNQSINLIASMPTMMVNAYQMKRRYYDKQSMFFHLPKPGQSTAEHILSTYRPDQKFTHEEAKLLDMCLLVHADHGGGKMPGASRSMLHSMLYSSSKPFS